MKMVKMNTCSPNNLVFILAEPITMDNVGDPFNGDPFFITLYAKQVGRFLCFRNGRLEGLVS